MANYPQLDDCSGVWTLKEVNNAVMGGYWRVAGSIGLCGAGLAPGTAATIDKIIFSTAGNATDFGDLSQARAGLNNSPISSFNRGLFTGGATPSRVTTVDYVHFASEGNGADFGDLIAANSNADGTSDSHGGL